MMINSVGVLEVVIMGATGIGLVFFALDLRAEYRLRALATASPSCGACGHAATLSMIASARCPECGTAYMVGGVRWPATMLADRIANKGVYVRAIVMGLLTAVLLGGVIGVSVAGPGAMIVGLAVMGVVFLCITVLPCVWIWWNRRAAMRLLRERVAKEQTQMTHASVT